ncbi:hypothetical protein I7I48_01684 [Histoplasma ohiense]|nr:hypothetical protein I7I48_01684 [Histoplasma ohiense (nom. inval.)]
MCERKWTTKHGTEQMPNRKQWLLALSSHNRFDSDKLRTQCRPILCGKRFLPLLNSFCPAFLAWFEIAPPFTPCHATPYWSARFASIVHFRTCLRLNGKSVFQILP